MRSPEYFARFCLETATRFDFTLVCYEQGAPHPSLCWPEMAEVDWRNAVMNAIKRYRELEDPKFVEPAANRPDWIFLCTRKGGQRIRIE